MRVIFCMFAEDVGLLPKDSFSNFLEKAVENEAAFEPELRALWTVMGRQGGERYASAIGGEVRYFNGGLFASAKTYSLSKSDRGELLEAAKADWTKVEPAIFGTLLEQALTPSERAKLGAHYTPRPYVERLVQATIMDVLEAEWEAVQIAESSELTLEAVQAFHDRLCALRILDPACGTGNFLYVAMENLMRLESDVIETIRQLGGTAEPRVGPQQFLGLELNPRAAVIAELVLWIGWLRWRMANDPAAAPEPVLKQFGNINFGGHAGYDAVLRRKPTGEPDTENPMIPDWPEADFIIGNPPFIGKGSQMRAALGDDYVEALSLRRLRRIRGLPLRCLRRGAASARPARVAGSPCSGQKREHGRRAVGPARSGWRRHCTGRLRSAGTRWCRAARRARRGAGRDRGSCRRSWGRAAPRGDHG